jgi:hypothetical protein
MSITVARTVLATAVPPPIDAEPFTATVEPAVTCVLFAGEPMLTVSDVPPGRVAAVAFGTTAHSAMPVTAVARIATPTRVFLL